MGNERGQSLVIALAVMFLLMVLGVTFILIVSKNLAATGRSGEQSEAKYLAEAGIRYADKMLVQSEDGADWRPVPDNVGAEVTGTDSNGIIQLQAGADQPYLAANHPDYKWVRPYWHEEQGWRGPTGGFTTFNQGDGRFLLRVTYAPKVSAQGIGDPLSKYIKIETVGRSGNFDGLYICSHNDFKSNRPGTCPNDSTVLTLDPTVITGMKTTLRYELTAYKPIGLTDYARFITNKEKRPLQATLGCPGFSTQYGWHVDGTHFKGAPIRVNGDVKLIGSTDPAFDGATADDRSQPFTVYLTGTRTQAGKEVPADAIEVTGDIEQELTDASGQATDTGIVVKKILDGVLDNTSYAGLPSNNSSFDTLGGYYRDGRDAASGTGAYDRSARRIDAPMIDQPDPATGIARYRNLTAYSGNWYTDSGDNRQYRFGQIGWGRGIYISNRNDIQRNSEGFFGGMTSRSDWLQPNNPSSPHWQGPYYTPPGVVITLNPRDTDGDKQPDITITRTDIIRRGQRYVWRDAWGNYRPDWGQTITVPYPTPFRKVRANGAADNAEATVSRPGNGIIFAEGNIRIKGMLPPGKDASGNEIHYNLTVVSGGTIYVEGNILKNRETDANGNVTSVDNSGSVALLATEYICVNTTQFVSMLDSASPLPQGSDGMNGEPPYHLIVGTDPGQTFRSHFAFGPWDILDSRNTWTTGDIYTFVRHSGQYGPSYINMLVNGEPYEFGNWPSLLPTIYGVGDPQCTAPGMGLTSSFEHKVWTLTSGSAPMNVTPGFPNFVEIMLAQSNIGTAAAGQVLRAQSDYLLSGFAIQPMNVRIEAIMYAQNKSFFVIPGRWFNPDPSDTLANMARNGGRPQGTDARFPFFGQPLDTRIVINGAVTENVPASVSDVTEWMQKWGWTPAKYGSSNLDAAHNQRGLTFEYDPAVGWPVNDQNQPYRVDKYGRGLAIAPRLPVSPTLIYYGEPL